MNTKPLLEWKLRRVVLPRVPKDIQAYSDVRLRRPDAFIDWGVWVLGPRLLTLLTAPRPEKPTGSLFWRLRRVRWERYNSKR